MIYGVNEIYFFDTYAIIEIIKGNPNYQKYISEKIIISLLNIIELHYILLKQFNNELANKMTIKYSRYVVSINLKDIENSNKFRLENIKKRFSTADAIGYNLALKYNVKFLTGDEGFRNIENVEFIK